jgi:putative oxidoreductase
MKLSGNKFDISLLLVRVSLGGVVGMHGVQKLLGWFDGYGFEGTVGFFTQTIGLPYAFAVAIILAESVGMIALIAGLFSRVLSAVVIVLMIGAILTVHAPYGFYMNWSGAQGGEGFEYHLVVIVLSGLIILNGAGAFSLDYVLKKMYSHYKRPSLV